MKILFGALQEQKLQFKILLFWWHNFNEFSITVCLFHNAGLEKAISPIKNSLVHDFMSLLKVKLELQLRCAVVSSLFYDIFFSYCDLC